jgi:RNA recognition motif-containing protein
VKKKIFVGNLDFDLKTEDMEKMFSKFGEIEDCIVITDRDSNRSKGFGFVTFVDEESVDKAIKEMNGKEIEGRKLTVNVAEEKERSHSKPRFEKREHTEEDEYAKYASTEF